MQQLRTPLNEEPLEPPVSESEPEAVVAHPDPQTLQHFLGRLFHTSIRGLVVLQAIRKRLDPIDGAVDLDRVTAHTNTRVQLFDLDDLEGLIDQAVRWNSEPGTGVFISAGLRREDLQRTKPGTNGDVIAASALKVDLDAAGAFEAAQEKLEAVGLSPNLIVTTASVPYTRAHFWWVLDEPETNLAAVEAVERTLKSWLGGDAVTDPRRIMRLAGSINWATKPGRASELVQLSEVRRAAYTFEELSARVLQAAPEPTVEHANESAKLSTERSTNGDYANLLQNIAHSDTWHVPMRSLSASLFAKGLSPANVEALCLAILKYRQGWGSDAQRCQLGELIRGAEKFSPGLAEAPNLALVATPYVWIDPATFPKVEWVYQNLCCRGVVTITAGAGGTGKSRLVLAEALAMASGRDLLADTIPVHRGPRYRVWYYGLEDATLDAARTIQATAHHFGLSRTDVEGWLFTNSGLDTPLCTATELTHGIVLEPVYEAIEAAIRDAQIDALIVDPFVSSHTVNENDNSKIDKIAKRWSRLAHQLRISVHLVHHVKKTGGARHDVEAVRGASAFKDAARVLRVLNTASSEEAADVGIPAEERRLYFTSWIEKQNRAAPQMSAQWFHLASVPLGNGEFEGVVERWFPAETSLNDDLEAVCRALDDADDPRRSIQSPDWAGHVIGRVLGLNSRDDGGKAAIKKRIKRWLAKGWIVVTDEADRRSEYRKRLRSPAWAKREESENCDLVSEEDTLGGFSEADDEPDNADHVSKPEG